MLKGEEGISSKNDRSSYSVICVKIHSPRACWFIAIEIGVSSIPVSEVSRRFRDLNLISLSSPVRSISSTAKSTAISVKITPVSRFVRIRIPLKQPGSGFRS